MVAPESEHVPARSRATIVACSSAPGPALRSIVRMSGAAVESLIHDRLDPPITQIAHMQATVMQLEPSVSLPLLAMRFAQPRSYTAEDMLELHITGQMHLAERVIESILCWADKVGQYVRHAQAGEFTRRAYENGRIDLARAEGVAATIGAASRTELAAAAWLREGALGQWAKRHMDTLAQLCALIEAGIDFTDEEDVQAIEPDALQQQLRALATDMQRMLDQHGAVRETSAEPWVVLVGRANAGKSSLFNALLRRQRAVVSDVAGTTRDVIIEPMALGGHTVNLVDLAGYETADDVLGESMQTAASGAMRRADLLISLSHPGLSAVELPADIPTINVLSHADRYDQADERYDLAVSARTGQGIDALIARIAHHLDHMASAVQQQIITLGPRHVQCISQTLQQVHDLLDDDVQGSPELIAANLRQMIDTLGEVTGEVTRDDVLGRIFSSFCIGK